MSNLATQTSAALIEQVLIKGDLSKLTEAQRVEYYRGVCNSTGLNPLTKPFEYITLNGKLTLYARRDATDQLRKKYNVSIKITAREQIGDVYVVTAQATMPDGRCDESTGAVTIKGLAGDALANAYLKCETKAKRRVTLSICGLGLLDETEVETIAEARPAGAIRAQALKEGLAEMSGEHEPLFPEENLGEKVISIGKQYKGLRLDQVGVPELKAYCRYFEDAASQEGKPLSSAVQSFLSDAHKYFKQIGVI